MKLTKRKLSIFTLAVALVLSLAIAFGINAFKPADADGTVTVSSNNVFTSTGNATVGGKAVGEGDGAKHYSTFTFTDDDDAVSYRRNVAYYWFEEVTEGEDDDEVKTVKNGLFNLEIGFKSTSFEKFVITFESQEYCKTKDGKSKNYVTFFPASEGRVYALISSEEDAELTDVDKAVTLDAGDIYIEFTEKYTEDFSGGYKVSVSNKDDKGAVIGKSVDGAFENVGGNYAKYSGSSNSSVYPLIFNTVFEKAEEGESKDNENVEMILYAFNGQSFETTSATANTVKDLTAPVLCLEEDITYLQLNGDLDIDYVVIDVLRQSPPTPTLCYYVLNEEQYNSTTIKDYDDKSLFKETKSAGDVILEAEKTTYMPSANELKNTAFDASYIKDGEKMIPNPNEDGNPLADMLVKVYFKLTDTSSNGENSEVFLDWYVENNEFLVPMTKGDNTANFLAVAKDGRGVAYNVGGKDGKSWDELVKAYQDKVTSLSKNLSAGSSSYFYLPSPESLFTDNATAYTDMKFSIYYFHDSKQSNTNLSYSNLSINITKEHNYTFTIYATDAAGNNMYYFDEDDGKVKEFKASDIWTMYEDKDKEGLRDRLPWFTFDVGYKGVEFEETPGMQSTAYVGSSYSFSGAFKINGVTNSYTTNYRLFLFNSALYYEENDHKTFTYAQFIEEMDEMFDDPLQHKYFDEILQVSENDADYEKYKDYEWNSNSTSFTPQDANAFYYVRAEVKDTGYLADPVTSSLAVVASENAKTIKGESDWLKNNIASVVLLVIAVLALIGIVLLIVIKPKDKGDVDVQLEKAQKKSKKSKEE